ncbi:heavy metal-binding domain-containing protein [Carnobacteriaceae bacterium zg-84]|nr:heavy metal-binding domain-containing protein [Carnobacteriaceae bacterium zg-84]
MLLTTTEHVVGYTIQKYCDVVFGEMMGFVEGLVDVAMDETELSDIREAAYLEMCMKASDLDANGIIGIRVHYQLLACGKVFVSCCGTAVKIEKA